MQSKGYITREYVVWCGCSNWHRETAISSEGAMHSRIVDLGWRYTKEHGWRCPQCIKREKANDKA